MVKWSNLEEIDSTQVIETVYVIIQICSEETELQMINSNAISATLKELEAHLIKLVKERTGIILMVQRVDLLKK
jgi:hypothetical protein